MARGREVSAETRGKGNLEDSGRILDQAGDTYLHLLNLVKDLLQLKSDEFSPKQTPK